MRPRKRKNVDHTSGTNADQIEIEYFKEKVACIKTAVEEELGNPTKKNPPKSYIDLAGQQIQKLLAAARKKKKERVRASQMDSINNKNKIEGKAERRSSCVSANSDADDSGLVLHKDPGANDEVDGNSGTVRYVAEDATVGRQPQNLAVVFKDVNNVKVLFQRMGMHNEETLESLMDSKKAGEIGGAAGGDADFGVDGSSKAPHHPSGNQPNLKAIEERRRIES